MYFYQILVFKDSSTYLVRMINFSTKGVKVFSRSARKVFLKPKTVRKRKHNANAQHNMGKIEKTFSRFFSVRMNMNDVLPCSLYYFSSHSLRITFFY